MLYYTRRTSVRPWGISRIMSFCRLRDIDKTKRHITFADADDEMRKDKCMLSNRRFWKTEHSLTVRIWTNFQWFVAQNEYSHHWKGLQNAHATLCSRNFWNIFRTDVLSTFSRAWAPYLGYCYLEKCSKRRPEMFFGFRKSSFGGHTFYGRFQCAKV